MQRFIILLAALGAALPAAAETPPSPSVRLRHAADAVLAWRTAEDVEVRLSQGLPVTRIGRVSLADETTYAARASALARDVEAVDPAGLSAAEVELRLSLLQDLRGRTSAAEDYWFDFLVTPYRGGDLHQAAAAALASAAVKTDAERVRYLALIDSYAQTLDAVAERTRAQRRRGMLAPKSAIPGVLRSIEGAKAAAPARAAVTPARLGDAPGSVAAGFRRDVEAHVRTRLLPAFDRLRAVFDDSYSKAAPVTVGIGQYPGGLDRYRRCIAAGTGLDLAPARIHEIGVKALVEIDARKDAIRAQLGFNGDAAAFDHAMRTDPRGYAKSAEEVAGRYDAFAAKIAPILPGLFSVLPSAPYGVKRLDPADEPGMTYGDYQPPSPSRPSGYYRFNGSGLETRTMIGAHHLIAHELMPGHHLQIALARESRQLHPVQSYLAAGPYVEGWAEYAAWLVEDAGLYAPYDLFGHLMMQSFLATRLVVDTGMNTTGLPLEQARTFMGAHTCEGPEQIATETLRYATDIPCQALGYYLGYDAFREGRKRAEAALGKDFDVRRFHAAMLSGGAVPLNILALRADRFIADEQAKATSHVAALSSTGISIAASPQTIWNVLVDRRRWMPAMTEQKMLRGAPDKTGGLYIYTVQAGDRTTSRLEEILFAEPGRRLVLRLADPDTGRTYAFVDHRIRPEGKGARLDFEMYWSEDVPGKKDRAAIDAVRADYSRQTVAKIDEALQRLKAAAEPR